MYQPRFHVGSHTSDFQPSLKPVPASCRVATKTFHVYQTLMNTFRLVACFQHEIPTGLNFTTFASRLSCLIFIFLVSCILSDFFERSCYSGKKGEENGKFITKGSRTTWSDQGSSLINGGFQIRADLACKHLFCPDFIKNQYFFQFFFSLIQASVVQW